MGNNLFDTKQEAKNHLIAMGLILLTFVVLVGGVIIGPEYVIIAGLIIIMSILTIASVSAIIKLLEK